MEESISYKNVLNYDNVVVGITSAFSFGLVFASFNNGFIYLLIWIILWEIILYFIVANYDIIKRIIYIAFYLLGFYLGRLIIGDDNPFDLYKEDL